MSNKKWKNEPIPFSIKIYSELGQCIYFLPLPKVTLSRQKIQTKNKQSHGTVQRYQIVY